jgi:ribosomal protein S18 acetylase RimI-like enzyme
VSGDNEAGIRFYERNGFEKVFSGKKTIPYYRVVNTFDTKRVTELDGEYRIDSIALSQG